MADTISSNHHSRDISLRKAHSSPVSRGYEIHHISPFLDYTTKHNRNSLNLGLKLMTRTNKAVHDCDLLANSTANELKPLVMSKSTLKHFKSKKNFKQFRLICPVPFALYKIGEAGLSPLQRLCDTRSGLIFSHGWSLNLSLSLA